MGWISIFYAAFNWTWISSKVVIGVANTYDVWGVLETKVISRPTPIWGGVKGMVVFRNSKVHTLVLTTRVGVTIGSRITLTCTTKVIICKGMI
jgi:hypothetical protein